MVIVVVMRLLERALATVERVVAMARERVSFCEGCGRNRYTGKPCHGEEEVA